MLPIWVKASSSPRTPIKWSCGWGVLFKDRFRSIPPSFLSLRRTRGKVLPALTKSITIKPREPKAKGTKHFWHLTDDNEDENGDWDWDWGWVCWWWARGGQVSRPQSWVLNPGSEYDSSRLQLWMRLRLSVGLRKDIRVSLVQQFWIFCE